MQKQESSDSGGQPEQKKQISEKGKSAEGTVEAVIINAHKLVIDSNIRTKSLQNSSSTSSYSSYSSKRPGKEHLEIIGDGPMKAIFNANVENGVTASKDATLSIGGVIQDSISLSENCVKLLKSSDKEKPSFSFRTTDKPTEDELPINNQSEKVCSALESSNNLNNATPIHGNGIAIVLENEVKSQLVHNLQNSVLSLDLATKLKSQTCSLEHERKILSLKKRKLLVLDINGLLADITPDTHHVHKGKKKVGGKVVFKRPFCDDFMNFCFEKFDVGIWSSRKKSNVDNVIDYILGENRQKLLFCWGQDHCTYTGFKTLENVYKPLVLKELKRLWNKQEKDLPWEEGVFSQSNTLLIDDSPYKALCNPPFTAVFPHPYQYDNKNDTSLGPGGDLRVYLEGLYEANDVRLYVQQHPFGQQAITSNDPSWNFYSQVIQKVDRSFVSNQRYIIPGFMKLNELLQWKDKMRLKLFLSFSKPGPG